MSHATPVGSREVTVSFRFISEGTLLAGSRISVILSTSSLQHYNKWPAKVNVASQAIKQDLRVLQRPDSLLIIVSDYELEDPGSIPGRFR